MIIKQAELIWHDDQPPVSRHYDDIYFSRQDGLGESRFVFLHGNQLPQRFAHAQNQQFVIAETGFGLGLNFLTLWQLMQQYSDNVSGLHFISFEQYPLSLPDLVACHGYFPELADLAAQLQQQWQLNNQTLQQFVFADGRIKLDLWLGDINHTIDQTQQQYYGKVDAWFLDGFTPSKNPEMWSEKLFNYLALTSKSGGTFATYTAAGFVRRALQHTGFEVTKVRGFRSKLEMLCGRWS